MPSPAQSRPSSPPGLPSAGTTARSPCPSPDYFAEPLPPLPRSATYESVPSPPPNLPTLRQRAMTVSTPAMSITSGRMAEASDLFERTAARAQEMAANGVQPERVLVATPPLMFPSVGPGLIVPPSPPAPAVVAEVHASAQIATPQPRRTIPAISRLTEVPHPSQVGESSRKDKKRPRLDTPSPSPSPAPISSRHLPGAIHRSSQTLRGRAALSGRPYALAPAAWLSPSSSHGRLAPATAAEIAEALRKPAQPVAGPSRLPFLPRVRTTDSGWAGRSGGLGSRLDTVAEKYVPEEPIFDDDLDIPLDLSPNSERETFAFDRPLRPFVSGSANSPADFDTAMLYAIGQESDANNDHWDPPRLQNPLDDGELAHQQPEHTAPTPSRPTAQSAASLAAATSFQIQTQPIPIPGQAGHQQPLLLPLGAPAQLAANQGLIPGNPGMGGGITFTLQPPGGFPEVLFAEPDGAFRGLARARVEALTAPPSGSDDDRAVILQVHNSAAPPQHEIQALTAAITAAIRQITGGLNPLVIPPEREWTPTNDHRASAPITWAAVGLSANEVRRILAQPAWSSTSVTLHVREPVIVIGRFMLVAGGFAHDHNGSILSAVFAVFVGPTILPMLFAMVQTNPSFVNVAPEDAVRTILASLGVRVSTLQNGNLIAAVFCDSPTQSMVRWREWRDAVAALPFPSPLNSTGFARRAAPCAGCHGEDHPTHLCPFQDVPGWNAPPPGTTWRTPGAALAQGMGGQQQPPPPPPPGGSSLSRTRSQAPRRNNSLHPSTGPKRDNFGGGAGGFGPGGGRSGFGPGGAGAGSGTFA
ncbi:hypothetical protein TRAPUB_1853 [Trametes pubescens]|uniref:Uncharacterized protein n=1 Tax=Trametes pubescens TaxID=154538 RepID=A0A1M2VIF3_TRAPU|nr:hypothetical protein TRAPUB_1853 [Trametes pubescens]